MADLSDFVSAITDLIAEFGGTGTYTTPNGPAVYNPATGTTVDTSRNITVEGMLMDLTLQSNGQGVKLGTLIEAGDKCFYCRPTADITQALMPEGSLLTNTANDRVTIGGVTYQVVTIKATDPAATGQPILFEIYLRR